MLNLWAAGPNTQPVLVGKVPMHGEADMTRLHKIKEEREARAAKIRREHEAELEAERERMRTEIAEVGYNAWGGAAHWAQRLAKI